MMAKMSPNILCTLLPIEMSPFSDNAIATIAKIGSNTPVIRNPVIAGAKLVPDSNPSKGGKIKFPAPKNKEKSINPENNTFFLFIKILLVSDECCYENYIHDETKHLISVSYFLVKEFSKNED